jgi:hypothetical protein
MYINHQPQNNNFHANMGLQTKNKYDHKAFSASCIANNNAFFLPSLSESIRSQSSSDSHHNVQRTPYRRKNPIRGLKLALLRLDTSLIAERVTVPENPIATSNNNG